MKLPSNSIVSFRQILYVKYHLNYFSFYLADNYPEPPKVLNSDVHAPQKKYTRAEYKELNSLYGQMLRQLRIFLRDLLSRFQ